MIQERETREVLAEVVAQQLPERGLRGTTYRSVAEQAGVSRAVVQYHYPAKDDFAVGFVEQQIQAAADYAQSAGLITGNALADLHVQSQIHFAFLADSRMRSLSREILENRALTQRMLDYDQEWAFDVLALSSQARKDMLDRYLIIVGGSYDLLYRRLSRPGAGDEQSIVQSMMLSFCQLIGLDFAESSKMLEGSRLNPDELATAVNEIVAKLS